MSDRRYSEGLWLYKGGHFEPIHTASDGQDLLALSRYFQEWHDFYDDLKRRMDDA